MENRTVNMIGAAILTASVVGIGGVNLYYKGHSDGYTKAMKDSLDDFNNILAEIIGIDSEEEDDDSKSANSNKTNEDVQVEVTVAKTTES